MKKSIANLLGYISNTFVSNLFVSSLFFFFILALMFFVVGLNIRVEEEYVVPYVDDVTIDWINIRQISPKFWYIFNTFDTLIFGQFNNVLYKLQIPNIPLVPVANTGFDIIFILNFLILVLNGFVNVLNIIFQVFNVIFQIVRFFVLFFTTINAYIGSSVGVLVP